MKIEIKDENFFEEINSEIKAYYLKRKFDKFNFVNTVVS